MATITILTDTDENQKYDVTLVGEESKITLATAGTYVDKNITVEVPEFLALQNENATLVSYSNEKTGANDSNISEAIQTLVAGFNKENDGAEMTPYYEASGEFTLTEEFTSTTYTTLYDLYDTNYSAPIALNSHNGSSLIICTMTCDQLDYISMSITLCSPTTSTTLTTRPSIIGTIYFRKRDGILYDTNNIVSPLSVAAYLQYNRICRVSGKCTTNATSSPAGTYSITFKAYDCQY